MKESILIKKDLFVVMYDKTLFHVKSETLKDEETGHTKIISHIAGSFSCNKQHASGAIMVKEFGKEYDAEYRISCSIDEAITKESYVSADGKIYQIVAFTETEQSKIFLIKEDKSATGTLLDLVNLEIIKGDLVASSHKDILSGLEIDEKGRFLINGQWENLQRVNDDGDLLVDPVAITEVLENDQT